MRGAGLILAAALGAGAAAAQDIDIPSVQVDPAVLWTCLGQGRDSGACLGAMTAVCMAENDLGNVNLKERLCVIEERNAWGGLNAREIAGMRRMLARLPDDPAAGSALGAFDAALAAWATWASQQCRLERLAEGRSGRRGIVEDSCMRDLAAERHASLRALATRLAEGQGVK